jgi:hypothetical protein
MAAARLNATLDKLSRRNGIVKTLRQHIADDAAAGPLETSEGNGLIDYSRTKFNRMGYREQAAYMAALQAKRYFYVNGWQVPKIVHDAVRASLAECPAHTMERKAA